MGGSPPRRLKRAAVRPSCKPMTLHFAPIAPPIASPVAGLTARPSARAAVAALARPARDAVAALALVCLATIVRAEVDLQDWIPGVLVFPDDAAVVTDREIGSTVRMFSVTTAAATGPLLETWEEALRSGGYDIERDADELLDNALEFSGPGISAAKIVANRAAGEGQTLIEFDATLD